MVAVTGNPSSSAVLTYSSSMYRSRQDSISKDMAQVAAFPVHGGSDEKIPVTPFALPTGHETSTDSETSPARRPTRQPSKSSFLGTVLRRRKTVGEQDEPPAPQQPLQIVPDFELNHEDPRYLKPRAISMAISPAGKTKATHSISLPFSPDRRPFTFGQDHAAESMRASYKREIQTKDARIKLLESHLVNLATGISEMDKDRKRLQSQARSSSSSSTTTTTTPKPKSDRSSTTLRKTWVTKSTPQVREDLSMLEQRMRSWAIKNSVTDISDLDHLDGEEKNIILEELDGFCAESDWNTLIRATPIVLHRMPALLAQAMLSKDVFATAFMNPFFAFAEDSPSGLPTSRMLKAMYSTMLDQAHVWRSQTLRVLSAPPSAQNEESMLAQRVREVTSELAVEFLNGPVQALLRTPRTEAELVKRNQELYSVYHSAGALALSLWTQRAFMKFHNLHGLQRFRTGNPAMTAHPLQHLSEDDERLDGKRVLLVVQPAVVAYGDEEAQNYDMCKIQHQKGQNPHRARKK
ncbi:hypothetical protein N8T08_000521 [Aspergillus melleus]|uniref:Uncharacterized protein n=1 Tax=Aspergillus melleus TaxID=138277 RepID=A0ACC3AR89_9EURO|nr:hypothetical protein N8T08_000521 [Aspergillus melleus]